MVVKVPNFEYAYFTVVLCLFCLTSLFAVSASVPQSCGFMLLEQVETRTYLLNQASTRLTAC